MESREIIGAADFSSHDGSSFDAYLWKHGMATDLGALEGDCFSLAASMNSSGQIAGNSFTCPDGV